MKCMLKFKKAIKRLLKEHNNPQIKSGSPIQHNSALSQRKVAEPISSTAKISPVTLAILTWNMGGDKAQALMVEDIYRNLDKAPGTDLTPTVISINTQEEMAGEGERLQDLLLVRLNKGLAPGEQYVLVETKEPQWHTSTAGAKGLASYAQRKYTDAHRVSAAMFVKKPYAVKDARATIQYEPEKVANGKKGNKSIITIEAKITLNNEDVLTVHGSGCHLDSHSEQKRRAHAGAFAKSQGLTGHMKTFEQIVEEASVVRLFSGDINERNLLYKDGHTSDPADQIALANQGFDLEKNPTISVTDGMLTDAHQSASVSDETGKQTLRGTYGMQDKKGKTMDSSGVKERKEFRHYLEGGYGQVTRLNRARGGFLDRVAISTGLDVVSENYTTKIEAKHVDLEKGRFGASKADHCVVTRNFSMNPPDSSPAGQRKAVQAYIQNRLLIKTYENQIKQLIDLKDCNTLEELVTKAKEQHLMDSSLTQIEYLEKIAFGPRTPDNLEVLMHRIKNGSSYQFESEKFLEILKENLDRQITEKESILEGLKGASKDLESNSFDEGQLTSLFNRVSLVNELKSSMQEVIGLDPQTMSDQKRADFEQYASKLVDMAYAKALNLPEAASDYNQEMRDDFTKFLSEHKDQNDKLKSLETFIKLKQDAHLLLRLNFANQPTQAKAKTVDKNVEQSTTRVRGRAKDNRSGLQNYSTLKSKTQAQFSAKNLLVSKLGIDKDQIMHWTLRGGDNKQIVSPLLTHDAAKSLLLEHEMDDSLKSDALDGLIVESRSHPGQYRVVLDRQKVEILQDREKPAHASPRRGLD